MENRYVCGIDLGTGNSCVAVIENARPEVVVNQEGRRTTPSVVFIKGDERKVGDAAKRGQVMNPDNTVSFIKRFMGADWKDMDVQKMLSMVQYQVNERAGRPVVDIDGREYTPEEISSMILAKMKKTAEDYLGHDVTDAVITCPAWFNNTQREATKAAGQMAGLNVLRVINEPTAAILSSDIDLKGRDSRIVAVTDVGCGTTDVSICEISDGVTEVLASYGDVFLGGQNYDAALTDWIAEDFMKDHPGTDLREDRMALARITEAAEKAKIELSTMNETDISLPYITVIDNVPQMYTASISRAVFEHATAMLTQRVTDCLKLAVKKAGKEMKDLDEVLLVGGSCRIPAIQEALKEAAGVPLDKGANLDEAVALGACIQANALANPESAEDASLLIDVTPISLGIETAGGMFTKLVEANTTIPASKSQIFTTAEDNQPAVTISVLQGERPQAADDKLIGRFNLDGIMPASRGVPQIEVTFDIDANGILNVRATDKATGKEQHITVSGSGNISKEEIERVRREAEEHKAEDEKKAAMMKEMNDAEGFRFSVGRAVDEAGDKVTADEKSRLEVLMTDMDAKLKAKDTEGVRAARKALEEVFMPISARLYGQGPKPDGAQAQPQPKGDDIQDADFEEVR